MRDMNTQIANASREQSAVAEEINQAIVRIVQIAEQSSDGAEETKQTNTNLAGIADQLEQRISLFRSS